MMGKNATRLTLPQATAYSSDGFGRRAPKIPVKLKTLPLRVPQLQPRLASLQPQSLVADKRIRGRRLQAERSRYRADNPLCNECQAEGKVVPWTELDHIVALINGGSDDGAKQGLCKRHHAAKTARDVAERNGRRHFKS
jgi:5-methylcytosine-specific restriction endonuclease McrA